MTTEATPGALGSNKGLGVWVPERESVGTGLLAQIAACKREVASWPDWMRTVAVLRIHPAAMDGRE